MHGLRDIVAMNEKAALAAYHTRKAAEDAEFTEAKEVYDHLIKAYEGGLGLVAGIGEIVKRAADLIDAAYGVSE